MYYVFLDGKTFAVIDSSEVEDLSPMNVEYFIVGTMTYPNVNSD